jgi:methyl-accepting chemotaxis protein
MPNRPTPSRSSTKIESPPVKGRKEAFAPVILLLLFGVWAIWLKQRAVDDSKWVQHTQLVTNAVIEVSQDMRAAESGQRGFVITGAEEYLEPWLENKDSVFHDVDRLANLTTDNTRQQELVAALRPVVAARMQRLDSTIATRRRGLADSAAALVRSGEGRKLMDSSLVLLRMMTKEEMRLLEARVEKEEADRRWMFIVLIGGVALSALFSVLVSLRLSDQAAQQWLTSAELSSRNHALQEQARTYEHTINSLRARNAELEKDLTTSL